MIVISHNYDQKRIERILSRIPVDVQGVAFSAALPKAAAIAKRAAEALAPDSRATGTHELKSQSHDSKWAPHLKRNIKTKRGKRKPGGFTFMLIGPGRPEGNKINFISPGKSRTKKVKLWGRDPVTIPSTRTKDDDFIDRAMEMSKGSQQSAFTRALKSEVSKKMRQLRNA